ncbi:Si-specific NAD(P)(+) transhydrogenase [Salinibius halmophilus]|uniref:Si-specific NAD(P)(+) transhydrogenase n=1 Tax=Salinibius halmophilus TaxID=1853216 RepID=UPI000E66FCF1|nr:Si-specific NAD(P)(+) transhydrogenase [Salinibius halmophilus]
MAEFSYDLVIIGTGPAGESAAMQAAKSGLSVAAIDSRAIVGGNCTHKGTIPSKALRHAVNQLMQVRKNPMFTDLQSTIDRFSFAKVREMAMRVVDEQVRMRTRFYAKNGVDLFNGEARFVGSHQIVLSGGENHHDQINGKKFLIATGSRPWQPPGVDFSHANIFDSDKILTLDRNIRRICIYGAGVIGSEYASIFSGLGIKVDLVNPGAKLLSFLDDEISDALSYHLRNQSVLIRHNEAFKSVVGHDDHVVVELESGKKIKADVFLWANGRTGNTDTLGLETLGLEANRRGQLEVNEYFQTACEHVYAVGDVIGWPSLASAAYDQGRIVAGHLAEVPGADHSAEIPTGIYTIPEISSVGMTERELTEAKVPYEVGKCYFKETARAQITGEQVGVLKLLFHTETKELLGIHCFGDQAAEILHIGQAIMEQKHGGNTIEYFISHTFNYPTMAEAYRVAAFNGLNRLG